MSFLEENKLIADIETESLKLLKSLRANNVDGNVILLLLILQQQNLLTDDLAIQIPFPDADFFEDNISEQVSEYFSKFKYDNETYLKEVVTAFAPFISQMNFELLENCVRVIKSLDKEILNKHFSTIFELLLYRIARANGRESGQFLLPVEISKFISSWINENAKGIVYNPFGGVASFGVFLDNQKIYFGQEINNIAWALGTMRLLANGKSDRAFYLKEDSIKDWALEKSFGSALSEKGFSVIVSNPPFGAKIAEPASGRFGPIRSYEQFLIEKGIEKLSENGKLIAVLSSGFLFRHGVEYELRRYLVQQDFLETVISFPNGLLMNTGIAVTVIIINKQKFEKGIIRFIDAKGFIESNSPREKRLNYESLLSTLHNYEESEFLQIAPLEKVKDNDYDLNVARYFQKKYEGIPLGEIGVLIRGQRAIEGQIGKFIRIRDLKDDALEYQLSLSNVEDVEIPRQSQKISESCILLAARWRTLKPTYFSYTGTPIFISPDILAFKVDETKCNFIYLINELHSNYVSDQLDSVRSGSVIPTIRKEDFLSIMISLPDFGSQQSLEKQSAAIKQRAVELANEKKRELTLFNKIHGLEAEMFEQNTYLRHTLAGPASNLKDSILNIKKIITEKITVSHPEFLDLKISEKHLVSLGEYLNIIERDANKIVKAVSSQLKVDTGIEAKKLSPIEIISFLEKYSNEYNDRADLNFKIKFEFDEEVFVENGQRAKTFILGNDELLRDLFDNLINNARSHAFQEGDENRIEIFIMKNSEKEDKDEVQILFSNTGKPFHEECTFNEFIRKGSRYGDNAGDGFGGWYINEIIKRLNGDFDIIDETGGEGLPGSDLATSFEINFPIIEIEENG